MASRVIHYIVGLQVAERVKFKTPERFFFGNMLPDCVDSPGGRTFGMFGRNNIRGDTTGISSGTNTRRTGRMNCIWVICVIW